MNQTLQSLRSRSPRGTLLAALALVAAVLVSAGWMLDSHAAADNTDNHAVASAVETGKAFTAVTREVAPAVVFIKATRQHVMTGNEQGFNGLRGQIPDGLRGQIPDELWQRFFGGQLPEMPMPRSQQPMVGEGSGFIISEDGYILTNSHVVGGADKLEVALSDGRHLDAKVVGVDKRTDVALIKVDAHKLPVLRMGDSDALEVGEWVLAIGSPFGLTGTVTSGIVSAKERDGMGITDYENFIQTDAAINPGNSGGPLVNLQGEAVGINTAILSRSGAYNGIGFAIPMNMARQVCDQLMEHGSVTRGYLGIMIQALTPELAKSFGINETTGVLVGDVTSDGPAAAAGMHRGDVVVALDSEPVKDISSFRNHVAMIKPNSTVKLEVVRDGKHETLSVTVGQLPDEGQTASAETPSAESPWGLSVQTIDSQLAAQLNVEPNSGVVVTGVDPASAAAAAGLQPGTIIREVNRQKVKDASDFARLVQGAKDANSLLLLAERDGRTLYVVLNKGA